jgi:hypothetical protein
MASYLIKHDLDGRLICDLSTAELRRRLAILRREGGDAMYVQAYVAILRDRAKL